MFNNFMSLPILENRPFKPTAIARKEFAMFKTRFEERWYRAASRAPRNVAQDMISAMADIRVLQHISQRPEKSPGLIDVRERFKEDFRQTMDSLRKSTKDVVDAASARFAARSEADQFLEKLAAMYFAIAALGAAPAAMMERTAENVSGLYLFVAGGIALLSTCLAKMAYSAVKFSRANALYSKITGLLKELEEYARDLDALLPAPNSSEEP